MPYFSRLKLQLTSAAESWIWAQQFYTLLWNTELNPRWQRSALKQTPPSSKDDQCWHQGDAEAKKPRPLLEDNNTEGINFNKGDSVAQTTQCTVSHHITLATTTFPPLVWSQMVPFLKYEVKKRASLVMLPVKTKHTQDEKAESANSCLNLISYTFT